MSQDFVRQLPGNGLAFQRQAALGDKVHLDFPLMFLVLCISSYGLLILFSAVGQQPGPDLPKPEDPSSRLAPETWIVRLEDLLP